jgi:hypothetical protein
MQLHDRVPVAQDAIEARDSLNQHPEVLRFASETEAEQWEQDGRVDDWEPGGTLSRSADER